MNQHDAETAHKIGLSRDAMLAIEKAVEEVNGDQARGLTTWMMGSGQGPTSLMSVHGAHYAKQIAQAA